MIQVNIALEEVNSKNYYFFVNSGKHGTRFVVICFCCSQSCAKQTHDVVAKICLFTVVCIAS